MAYVTASRPVTFIQELAHVPASLIERAKLYRSYRQTVSALNELTTRDLSDLGIGRAGIESVAHEAVYGVAR